ncbi:hypothetical protein Ae356Ps1_6112 [Pseudonocardia sp. Ae356_Ps1]|nr:hypothetical protein Ae356Ps1_6112 [Pseudonocardia sp. Ae356_Ps1]OLL89807.1 hypothetical protein Ae331Ps2_6143c [Pseudonocardia sp. Ae331_Ps2]
MSVLPGLAFKNIAVGGVGVTESGNNHQVVAETAVPASDRRVAVVAATLPSDHVWFHRLIFRSVQRYLPMACCWMKLGWGGGCAGASVCGWGRRRGRHLVACLGVGRCGSRCLPGANRGGGAGVPVDGVLGRVCSTRVAAHPGPTSPGRGLRCSWDDMGAEYAESATQYRAIHRRDRAHSSRGRLAGHAAAGPARHPAPGPRSRRVVET